jgi:hypothetical protein
MRERQRSIWEFDRRFLIDRKTLVRADLRVIARLHSVEAAKKQIQLCPLNELTQIATVLRTRSHPDKVTSDQFAEFLAKLRGLGRRIPTAVCMLAVSSGGMFPPMDRKVALGLLKFGVIERSHKASLCGNSVRKFSDVYVNRVVPEWRLLRSAGLSPKDIDDEWTNAGAR